MTARCSSLLVLGLLAGCAAPEGYPSLAPRAVEQQSLAEPVRAAPPTGTAPPAADARFADLVAQARSGDAAFRRTLFELRPVLERGRGAPFGSDPWAAAQTGLSRVQAARLPVTQALLGVQAAGQAPEVAADTGLTAAARRALNLVAQIDRDESDAVAAVTPTTAR